MVGINEIAELPNCGIAEFAFDLGHFDYLCDARRAPARSPVNLNRNSALAARGFRQFGNRSAIHFPTIGTIALTP